MSAELHAVIFDIDGTLLRSAAEDDALYRQAATDVLGAVAFREGLQHYDHVTDTGILLQVLADNEIQAEPQLIEAVKARFFELMQSFIDANGAFPAMPGAHDFVQMLAESPHHGVAIATGGWRRSAEMKLRAAGFSTEFCPLASSDDASERTGIMRHAQSRIEGAIEGTIAATTYYGDGLWDQNACRELGWQFRAVGSGLGGLLSFDDEWERYRR